MEFNFYSIKSKGIIFKSYEVFKGEHLVYRVKGSLFLRKYLIFDQHGLELMQIKRSISLLSMNFKITRFENYIAEITKVASIFSNNLNIESINGTYFAEGNFRANDFTIFKDDIEIAKISRHGIFADKKYGLAILDSEDQLLIISIVMTIEMILRVKNARKGG